MADLLQVGKGTSIAPIVVFEYNGAGQNLDSGLPTVTLTRPDGTAGPAVGTVNSLGAGQYSFVVAGQDEVTWLDYLAVGTVGGQVQKLRGRVEWIEMPLFNISAFRALRVAGGTPFAASGVSPIYTDRQIMDKRTAVLDEMQAILGFPPVARFVREPHDGDGGAISLYGHKEPRLLSVSVAGVAQPVGNYNLSPYGILRPLPGTSIPWGYGNVVVEYVSGWPRPYGECSDAAMIWVAKNLNPSGFTNATTISTPDGATYTYERRGGFTGVADLDRWLDRHRVSVGVA